MEGAAIQKHIESLVNSNPLTLFMKGTPEAPLCGFSSKVVEILKTHGALPGCYAAVDVLAQQELREGIKEYSKWPTIPQLFVGGDFVGGCDVVIELAKDGKLGALLKEKAGIKPPPTPGDDFS